ncbi:hypothetical protein EVAR_101132_1 [Eumeta japonica]|uniref:Uncharacterized protein n=1 Tax=Eumeta variegata TaxID=151549 RepID=A0A4C2ACU6_EUMVA|nr:hypothetical protein EVAR_101132_1 [Eumeta japonica]
MSNVWQRVTDNMILVTDDILRRFLELCGNDYFAAVNSGNIDQVSISLHQLLLSTVMLPTCAAIDQGLAERHFSIMTEQLQSIDMLLLNMIIRAIARAHQRCDPLKRRRYSRDDDDEDDAAGPAKRRRSV